MDREGKAEKGILKCLILKPERPGLKTINQNSIFSFSSMCNY